MSYLFEIDQNEKRSAIQRGLTTDGPSYGPAGALQGIPTGLATGALASVNDAAMLLGDAATPVLQPWAQSLDERFGTNTEEWLNQEKKKTHDAARALMPDPMTVGKAGQIVHGIANTFGDYAIGTVLSGGNPLGGVAGVGLMQGNKAGQLRYDETGDAKLATGEGLVTGAFAAAGALLPAAGPARFGFAGNMALGAGINVGTGAAQRDILSRWFDANGRQDLAAQYHAFDGLEMAIDAGIGAIFGGLHQRANLKAAEQAAKPKPGEGPAGPDVPNEPTGPAAPEIKPSDLDALMTMGNAAHVERDTLPGAPEDMDAKAAHVEAMQRTLSALARGEEPDLGDLNALSNFAELPKSDLRMTMDEAVAAHMGPEWQATQEALRSRNLPDDINLYDLQPNERQPVRFTDNVRNAIAEWEKTGDTSTLLGRLKELNGKLEDRAAANAEKGNADRVRGALWVKERITRAERLGEITPEAAKLVHWLIDQNPNIADELGLSLKSDGARGEAGSYNPAEKVATIIKDRANDETAAHEILHHGERLMPEEVRQGIRHEWISQLESLHKWATDNQVHDLMKAVDDALRAAAGDREAYKRVAEQIQSGELPRHFYQFINPSEFWAVNAARLVNERANAAGWIGKARQWLKEFIEKVKGAFGFDSKAAVIRGLDAVLKSDGEISGKMIGDPARLGDVYGGNGAEALYHDLVAEGAKVDEVAPLDKLIASDKIPRITLKDLVGKKIFPTIADRTRAGALFEGIDGSKLKAAVPLLGGPNFPLRESNMDAGVVWANRGKGVTTVKAGRAADGAEYMMVVMGSPEMHQSNTTVATSMIGQLESYLRDRRITKEQAKNLDALIHNAKEADPVIAEALRNFPTLADPEAAIAYLDSISFEARKRVANLLSSVKASDLGAPNFQKILGSTIEPEYAGHRWGDGVLLLKLDNEKPLVTLGEGGTQMHPDYPYGVRGEVVGKLDTPVNYELLWQDWLAQAREAAIARGTDPAKINTRRAFELGKPVVEVTEDLVNRIGDLDNRNIESARQARLAVQLANDRWATSDTFGKGGERSAAPAEFFHAMRASDGSALLPDLPLEQITKEVRAKTRKLIQLDDGSKDGPASGVWASLRKEGDGRMVLDAFLNNEKGAKGFGGAIIAKAVEEGATHAEIVSVPTAAHPMGRTVEMLEALGFTVEKSKKFSAKTKAGKADLNDTLQRMGWKEGDGEPHTVTLKWEGTDADRAEITRRYLAGDFERIPGRGTQDHVAAAEAIAEPAGRQATGEGRGGKPDTGANEGDQGHSRSPVASGIRQVIADISVLSDNELANLGLRRDDLGILDARLQHIEANGALDGVTQALLDKPLMEVADDNGQTVLAAKMLADADAAIASAEQTAPGFEAAVACALRG